MRPMINVIPLRHTFVPILLSGLTAAVAFGCKQADFSGGSTAAGPSATRNSSGSVGGASAPGSTGPGVKPGNSTDAGGAGGGVAALPGGPGSLSSSGGAVSPGASPGATSSSTNLFSTLAGVLGAAGSVAGSVVQAATPKPPANMNPCSDVYFVPGTANPYMAGEPAGTTITYDLSQGGGPNPTDTAAADAPIQVIPKQSTCIVPGNGIYFFVYGMITYDKSVAPVNANGNLSEILAHQKSALFGKSNVVAPLCALMGVFLGPDDPTNSTAPQGYDFSTLAARDYTSLNPDLGKVFFIGTGQTSSGAYHQITVPTGATRLFLAAMDTYQWNNNIGGVSAQLMVLKSN